ncbi:MAG: PTS system mannose/fructose/sorbose family transporter subunit IID [bacterium]
MTATASTARGIPAPGPTPRLTPLTWVSIFGRLLAMQGSWNYETLIGNGIAFAIEPALRRLPGGVHGDAFKIAMTRESAYFNAHPYLASVAVGALARAELSGVPAERIERFRTALCGPLGSVGDRLVWAGWLPLSSLVALIAFGLGAGPLVVVLLFLVMYNTGHFGLRIWGLYVGWTRGLGVAGALGNPVLRQGPAYIARAAATVAGVAIPLAAARIVGQNRLVLGAVLLGGTLVAAGLVRLHGRVEGWKLVLVLIAVFALVSVAR